MLFFGYILLHLLDFENPQERREWIGQPIGHDEIACSEEQMEKLGFGRWGQP